MNSIEFIQRLEELKSLNFKFKYYYTYITNCGCFDEMWINDESQTVQYLIDCIKDDLEAGRVYNTISYDTDDYYRRYVDINDIIIKDGLLEFI